MSEENISSGMLAVIERAAVNPEVDVQKMEKLLDMQERIFNKNAEISFNQAMVKCQGEIPLIKKTGLNQQTNSQFAKLEEMQIVAMPFITSNGFCLSYGTSDSALAEHYRVTCLVSHTGGHSREYQADIPADFVGMKGQPNKTKTHGAGSSLSYGQRYLMKMIFNIKVVGMDSDGNSPIDRVSKEQSLTLQALIDEVGASGKEALFKWAKIESLDDLPASKYKQAVVALEKRRKAA